MISSIKINDVEWDQKEFDWTDKAFYFIPLTFIFYKPLAIGSKLEQLNREVHRAGYKVLSNMVLVQHAMFKGRALIEVEKMDKYDAQILHFEERTTVDTIVYRGSPIRISRGIKRLSERVASKRNMAPREVYYMYVTGSASDTYKTIIFGLT